MKNTSKILQDYMDSAWCTAYRSRPIYQKRSKKLDARWDRLNDFVATDKFDELTDEQQKAVVHKMDKISDEIDCIEAVLECLDRIMEVSEDLDCALAEMVE